MNSKNILIAFSLTAFAMNAQQISYPKAPKDSTVSHYFGMDVPDPYRPLENDTAAATTAWVDAENDITAHWMEKVPFRNDIHTRLTALADYPKHGLPARYPDGKYYYFENNGLQNQSVLYRADDAKGTNAQVFLDPNTLSTDGTVALTGVSMSPDGKYFAYRIARSGSDWTEIYLVDPVTGTPLDDHIKWAKFTGTAWHGDGFYYSAYPIPEAGKEFSNANEYHNIYYHKIGTPQSQDSLVFHDENAPRHFHSAWTDDKATVLALSVGGQGNGNGLIIKRLDVPDAPWQTVVESQEDAIDIIDVISDNLLILTSKDAPNYQIVTAPLSNPSPENWQALIPQQDNVIVSADISGEELIVTYLRDAAHHAYRYDLSNGSRIAEIALPGYGSVGFSTSKKTPEVLYSFTSFTMPGAIYSLDKQSGVSTPIRNSSLNGFHPDDYVTEQIFFESKDGTRVPMFVTYKKGLKKDGKNPTYLYGYGGFNISLTPSFSPYRLLWLENGGVFVSANMRGGGEYGEKWHEAGTLMHKQNVFDDFIAAAEYLVSNGWTSPELLTIEGGSNGGLLVGAVVNQRPELFAVAIPRVGVMDMMRYHLFTIGWNWAHDYGTSDDSPEMAEYLLSYSPLHTIRNGVDYPAILVTTADHDDRVVPAHSFKYAATLQAAETGNKPKLIRIDRKAGHGAGKPVSKVIDEWTDIYSFIFNNLGITPDK